MTTSTTQRFYTCPTCCREVSGNEVTPTKRHNVDDGGCGNPLREILEHRIDPPTFWDRYGYSIGMTVIAIGLAVVILFNYYHP